jgi:hypothetical protein
MIKNQMIRFIFIILMFFSVNLKAEDLKLKDTNVTKLLENGYVIKSNWHATEEFTAYDKNNNMYLKTLNVVFFYLVKPINYSKNDSGNVKSTRSSIKICKVIFPEETTCMTP